ncbi:hemin ABC transporter substrate-binding protein [Schumannella luteola]|uniref:Iron complex transport system substrate-binding protein n=1 Tax=Schumannella luteola TaxID=472059 RepID=A0A852YH37_9MICO|nr:ABC transporter substrate-binding protein [Schumannella luteola]NYG98358.1 iron complex transport system substrate-binding protein [Schumannella luteola]TPX05779.1 ABC transporter substrate-binding protein [Schumannella luteola]
MSRPIPRTRRAPLLAGAALALLALAGCSAASGSTADAGAATPKLSTVKTLADPKSWQGPSTAKISQEPVEPITTGAQKLPVKLTDTQGEKVTVKNTDRILALDIYGSISRVTFELGLGDKIVGRDISSGFAEIQDRPLVTHNGHDLNAEAILALNPTLIITDTSLGPWDTILQMRDAGVTVVTVASSRSLEKSGELVGQIATALGVPQRGEVLSKRIDASVAKTEAQIAKVAPSDPAQKLRVVFLYVRGQAGVYYMFGTGSGADDLVTALGGVDVAGEIGWSGMRPLTDEGLVAARPDVILMMTKGLESVDGVDGLLEKVPALQQTPAGQNKRVVDMSDTEILSFGPDSSRVLDALAVALYAPKAAGSATAEKVAGASGSAGSGS